MIRYRMTMYICSVAKARVRPSKRIWLLKDPIKEACLTNWTKSCTLTVNQLSKYEYFIKINWFCPYLGLGCCFLCYHSCPRVKGCYFPIRVFICICPSLVGGNFMPMGFPARIKKGEKQNFAVHLRSKFSWTLDVHLVHSIQFNSQFKIVNNFEVKTI